MTDPSPLSRDLTENPLELLDHMRTLVRSSILMAIEDAGIARALGARLAMMELEASDVVDVGSKQGAERLRRMDVLNDMRMKTRAESRAACKEAMALADKASVLLDTCKKLIDAKVTTPEDQAAAAVEADPALAAALHESAKRQAKLLRREAARTAPMAEALLETEAA